MAKAISYREVLDLIKPPSDLPETIECKMCGEPMHLTRINELVFFWLHRGKSIGVCCEKNILNKGFPLIRRDLSVYRNIAALQKKMRGLKDE